MCWFWKEHVVDNSTFRSVCSDRFSFSKRRSEHSNIKLSFQPHWYFSEVIKTWRFCKSHLIITPTMQNSNPSHNYLYINVLILSKSYLCDLSLYLLQLDSCQKKVEEAKLKVLRKEGDNYITHLKRWEDKISCCKQLTKQKVWYKCKKITS